MSKDAIEAKKCLTPKFRLSYPHLFEPTSIEEGQEKKYGLTMLFPKNVDLSAMKKAATAAAAEKWGAEKSKWPKNIRLPFRDGDEKSDSEGYADHIFVSARSKKRPGIVDQALRPILMEEDIYAGCYARATLIAFAYDTAGNKGVSFSIMNVQKLGEGQPLSGRRAASEDFDAVEENDDATAPIENDDWM